MASLYIKSNKGNYYHFNSYTGIYVLISPIIFEINLLMKGGYSESEILTTISSKWDLTSNEFKSYLNQYFFFEKSGSQYTIDEKYDMHLTPEMIETALSNLQQITFEVTDACNLKCKYCGYGEFYQNYDVRTSKNLPIKQAKNLIRYLSNYWSSKDNLSEGEIIYISFYGGEPLLNMSFIKNIVRLFDSNNIKRPIRYSMTTNAILLKKHISYLMAHDFQLLISLDGNKYNNSYRVSPNGKNSYDIVYNNMKYIQKEYPQFFKNNIEFNSVIHDRNSVNDILNFFKNEFSKTPSIGELNLNGVKIEKKDEFKSLFKDISQSIKDSTLKKTMEKRIKDKDPFFHSLTAFIHNYNIMSYSDYNSLFTPKKQIRRLPTGTCIPFSKKLFITVNGKILPCERIGQEHSLGYATSEKVEIDLEKICKQYNSWLIPISRQCHTCYIRRSCQQCIFNFPDINKPFCIDYMNTERFTIYLKRIIDFFEKSPQSYRYIMKDIIIR